MHDVDRFKDYIKRRGLLMTQERLMIAETVFGLGTPFSIENMHSALHHKGYPISAATIYRNIRLLTRAGLIENLTWKCSGKSLFRRLEPKTISCGIQCTDCDCEHIVNNDKLEKAVLQLCKEFNMEQTGIVINIKGQRKCNCRHKKNRNKRNDN